MMKKTPVKKLSATNERIMHTLARWCRSGKPWGPQAYDEEEKQTEQFKKKVERYNIELDQWRRDRDGIAQALQLEMIGFNWNDFLKQTEET